VNYAGERYLVEPVCDFGTVFIFGGGHISQKLAPLARLVGFRVVVLDDRPEFVEPTRFPQADGCILVGSFEHALEEITVDPDSYLVIVTRGHLHDKTVLAQALHSEAAYIGMIGSRRKRDAIYTELATQGFSPADFKRVFSPIGLPIEAETPEEIAVSIMAELIQVRAGRKR
jgi:xanthine dehydrogenase accessory factor